MSRKVFGAALAAAFAAIGAAPASAHNAGHIVLDNGMCVNQGSGNPGPFVSASNPHFHTAAGDDYGRLDLIPGTGDQYGARFAAVQGNSRVDPRWCEEVGLTPGPNA
jgi:hypothetical protein